LNDHGQRAQSGRCGHRVRPSRSGSDATTEIRLFRTIKPLHCTENQHVFF
jgi:hypothetical protein